jgi:hypothetical protein
VTDGVLWRTLRLKEVERSEEGPKISKGNTWGRRSPRISDGGGDLANSDVPCDVFWWQSRQKAPT